MKDLIREDDSFLTDRILDDLDEFEIVTGIDRLFRIGPLMLVNKCFSKNFRI